VLPGDAQGLAAGGQDLQARAGAEQGVGERRAGPEQVLAVVQHQQEAAGAERVAHRREQRAAGLLLDAHRRRDGLRHERRVRQRRQLHRPHPVRVAPQRRGGDPEGEAGLARPARPSERQQRGAGEDVRELGQGALTADETGEVAGQVVRVAAGRGGRRCRRRSGCRRGDAGGRGYWGRRPEGLGAGAPAAAGRRHRCTVRPRDPHVNRWAAGSEDGGGAKDFGDLTKGWGAAEVRAVAEDGSLVLQTWFGLGLLGETAKLRCAVGG
jgi:hypothetical protein